jgi:hypothetical protein
VSAESTRGEPSRIGVGDIVVFEQHTWEVLSATVLPEALQLRLARREQATAPTPYGQPQRYRMSTVERLADARQCRLVAHQAGLF